MLMLMLAMVKLLWLSWGCAGPSLSRSGQGTTSWASQRSGGHHLTTATAGSSAQSQQVMHAPHDPPGPSGHPAL